MIKKICLMLAIAVVASGCDGGSARMTVVKKEELREVPVGTQEESIWKCRQARALVFTDERCKEHESRGTDIQKVLRLRHANAEIVKIFATDARHPLEKGFFHIPLSTKYYVYFK